MELPRGFDYSKQGVLTMQPLEKSLRNRLERTVTDARTIAETAAKENSNYSYSGGGK
jgi:hypothetical protein